jgi:hypothetical protein
MAKYYCRLSAGDTVNSILANGGAYDVNISQDLDCQDVDCRKITATGEVKCTSTTAPFYPPVVTTSQRNSISGMTKGAMVFNSTTNKLNVYNGSAWEVVTSS